jgi:hypothetical protein
MKDIPGWETRCTNVGNASVKHGIKQVTKDVPLILDQIHTRAPNALMRILLYPAFVPATFANNCNVLTYVG